MQCVCTWTQHIAWLDSSYADGIVAEAEAKAQSIERKTRETNDGVMELEATYQALTKKIEDQQKHYQELEDDAELHREAIAPTAAGTAAFVLKLLLGYKQYQDGDAAHEYIRQFMDIIERHKKGINKKHEDWRAAMKERRRADKQVGYYAQRSEHTGYEIE